MPTPEMNVLFFYPSNSQPTFSAHLFPHDNTEPQQLLVLGTALIEVPFETPKLVPVFLQQGKTHFGDEFWSSDKHGELLILAPEISDEDRTDAPTNKLNKRCLCIRRQLVSKYELLV